MTQSGRFVRSSAINTFIDRDRISALLAPWVPEPQEREFVVRCILDEGPAHHRGTNYVLLALLGILLERGGPPSPREGPVANVGLRLPPHLVAGNETARFPLPCPTRPLELLADPGDTEHAAMVDCVTDGPPQHALANAAMMSMIDVLLDRSRPPC
ncbi:MAG: hypothetical protein ACAI25_14985 [Planctomycetota bacterium]